MEEGEPLLTHYKYLFKQLAEIAHPDTKVTPENVCQQPIPEIKKIIDDMIEENILDDSRIEGVENLKTFLDMVKAGKHGLILMEHYSNFDLPGFSYFLRHGGKEAGKEIDDRLVAIAGMKLTEESPIVSAWATGYARINIYPSRSLAAITDPVEHEKEDQHSRRINMAAMRAMDRAKKDGKVVLVFPSGTRYRPGKPETKRGLREIDSYLRLFDVMILVSINGNCLRISTNDPSNMMADVVCKDTLLYGISPVMECKKFRDETMASLDDSIADKKQPVIDALMNILENQHNEFEAKRRPESK